MDDRLAKYYSFRGLGPITVFYVMVAMTLGVVRMLQGRWTFTTLMTALVIGTPVLVVFAALILAIYPLGVYTSGLKSYNSFGIIKRIRWDEIAQVTEVTPFWGLTWLAVRKEGEGKWTSLWVPLFLDNLSAFRVMLMHTAPAGNPLRTYFDSHP